MTHGCFDPSHCGRSDVTTLAIWPTGERGVTGSSLFARQNSTLAVCTEKHTVDHPNHPIDIQRYFQCSKNLVQIQGKKGCGRPRTMFLDWLLKMEEDNISYDELKMLAQDRSNWRT